MDTIVKSSSEFVTRLLNENLSSKLTYHNLSHANEVFDAVTELGKNSNLPEEDLEIIQVAAWFHDTGFINGCLNHEYKSVEIAKEFLENMLYPVGKIKRVTDIIIMTELANVPNSLSEKIIRDADILHIGKDNFLTKCLSLRSEWELIDHKKITESAWLQTCLDFISKTMFFTDYAKLKYEAVRQSNIACLKGMLQELNT
jgi:predicted metal-dependent HD superfamily phosphohydrolase